MVGNSADRKAPSAMNRSARRRRLRVALVASPLLALPLAFPATADAHRDDHTVYTLSNSPAGNEVLSFGRTPDGNLAPAGSYATGGTGTGAGLGSQGAIVLDRDEDRILAVNAGSDSVSLFRVGRDGRLTLVDTESSGGDQPVSVTVRGRTAYVLNAASNTISGLRVTKRGLEPIADSTQALSGAGGAQVSFVPGARQLVVTEKATNTIDVFPVGEDGRAGAPVSNPSNGQTPFGFDFGRRGTMIVSNAAGGAPGASSLSTYRIGSDGYLVPLDGPTATGQSAACWVVAAGKFAYATNTGSGNVTGVRVEAAWGELSLLSPDGISAVTGAGPIDADVEDGDLFTLNARDRTITVHGIDAQGGLHLEGSTPLPTSTAGLAVR